MAIRSVVHVKCTSLLSVVGDRESGGDSSRPVSELHNVTLESTEK